MRVAPKSKPFMALTTLVVGAGLLAGTVLAKGPVNQGQWVAGDFHTHTYLTDGERPQAEVVSNAFGTYGLDWMANSEHGGTSARDPQGNPFPSPVYRWITLSHYSFPIVDALRQQYPDKLLVQGVEWNVPTHEHASVGIVADEPAAISNFEYMFDAGDGDTSRANEGLAKQNATHDDSVAAARWLEDNYETASYLILNHPSRKLLFSAADIRDLNNAAPDVCFGLEGLPGHQKEGSRGGYSSSNPLAQTYGGADYMLAKVGGLMDSLWGEGRNFWIFVNSDFHNDDGDFWPGEYGKSYTWVQGDGYQALVDGLRSGRSFAVEGDLINALEFSAKSQGASAEMGGDLSVAKGQDVLLTIRFRSPEANNNGDKPVVDHIDLIAGDVTGIAQPGTDAYNSDTNESAKVIATFTAKDCQAEKDGWTTITYKLENVEKDQYFRLRGTNLGFNVENQTDAEGNPLSDALMGTNDAAKAYDDLWFYSNPVFVSVQ